MPTTPVTDALMDELTVVQCVEGRIDYRKLTMPERDAVFEIMRARGYGVRQIAVRCHANLCLVQDAAIRVRARDAEQEGTADDAVVA